MDNVEQVIADIRGRNVSLSVRDGKIIANPPLLPDEKEVLRENRERAIAIISATPETSATPEAPIAACDCAHHKEGHAAGYLLASRTRLRSWRRVLPSRLRRLRRLRRT